ncbi:MAG: hypothetical protein ACREN6_03405 [Gemmatimonadaceae bacterium]
MRTYSVLALAFCSACGKSSQALGGQEAAADSVITAAAAGNWSRVKALTRGLDAESRFEAMARDEPLLLRQASGHLTVVDSHAIDADSSYVSFRFPYRDSTEVFDMRLGRDKGQWIVYYVTLPRRM